MSENCEGCEKPESPYRPDADVNLCAACYAGYDAPVGAAPSDAPTDAIDALTAEQCYELCDTLAAARWANNRDGNGLEDVAPIVRQALRAALSGRVPRDAEPTDAWAVVFKRDAEPIDVTLCTESFAREAYDRLSQSWTGVYLCRVVDGPRDELALYRSAVPRPAAGSGEERAA
jgi:hypothetical protein